MGPSLSCFLCPSMVSCDYHVIALYCSIHSNVILLLSSFYMILSYGYTPVSITEVIIYISKLQKPLAAILFWGEKCRLHLLCLYLSHFE